MSTFAVASSITIILFLISSALARHNNWRWPTLKLKPPSVTGASNLLSNSWITSFNSTYDWEERSLANFVYGNLCTVNS